MKLLIFIPLLLFIGSDQEVQLGKYAGEITLNSAHRLELTLHENETYKTDETFPSYDEYRERGSWQMREDTLVLIPKKIRSKRKGELIRCKEVGDLICNENYLFASGGNLYFFKENESYSGQLERSN